MARSRQQTKHRLLSNGFIAAFVMFSVAVPLSYYLGDNPDDERFAWRMFSAMRFKHCSVAVQEQRDGGSYQTLPLMKLLHNAWPGNLARNRTLLTQKFLHQRCKQGAQSVRLVRRCRRIDGLRSPLEFFSLNCTRQGAHVERRP